MMLSGERGKADRARADVLQPAALGPSEFCVRGKAGSCCRAGPCDFVWMLALNSRCVLSAWPRSGVGSLSAGWRLGAVSRKILLGS